MLNSGRSLKLFKLKKNTNVLIKHPQNVLKNYSKLFYVLKKVVGKIQLFKFKNKNECPNILQIQICIVHIYKFVKII